MAVRSWISASLCAAAALAVPMQQRADAPTVTIKNGTIEGVHNEYYNQDYFLSVPFAQPPVGSLRFRTPQSLNTTFNGTYSAKEFRSACVGYGSDDLNYPSLSEDCLYLNVIRPSGYEDQKLPVGFWIHGGGLYEGSSIDPRYNTSFIIQRSIDIGKPMMTVAVNYRLSMWGFITGDEVIESGNANLGFRDQRLALHWVQENIAAFGGDPEKVTIWGESAGALSVGMQLVAYNGRDDSLFRGAVMESGNPINYGTFDTDNESFENAVNALGCADASSKLDCLRAVPYEALNNFINSTLASDTTTSNMTSMVGADPETNRWAPVVDGDFIQDLTSKQLASGRFVQVPIIDGANSDEGTAFGNLPSPNNNESYFRSALETLDMPKPLTSSQASQVLAAYPYPVNTSFYELLVPANLPANWTPPADLGVQARRSLAYYGDATMIGPRRATCQAWSNYSVPAFCYRFNTKPLALPDAVGVTHFQEVGFVFDNTAGQGYDVDPSPFLGAPATYADLAANMSAAWASFVVDLHPGEFWPQYDVQDGAGYGQNWVFDANVTGLGYTEVDDWRKEGIDLINANAVDFYGR